LAYLGDLSVNGSSIKGQMGEPGLKTEALIPVITDNADPTKVVDTSVPCQNGWRNIIVNEGPEAFAKAIRGYKGCVRTDISVFMR
jgi:pyruvate carboxylase